MAKYNKTTDSLRKAKEFISISYSNEQGHLNTLKSYDKLKRYNELYEEGMQFGMAGDSIDNETELVDENGKMIPKNTHRNFLAGYKEGLKHFQEPGSKNNTSPRR